ncbi:MAG TPA: CHC2 zinc finger domain-containing protein, partial [Blastocatellia bacterium]|nr:CHC2 zinc finger domain-containing protein [Blastocatellia bacterium]
MNQIDSSQPISISSLKAILPHTLLQLVQAEPSVKLKRDGKAWKGYCPFHRDFHPSFSVYWGRLDNNWRFHCPGCGADGDIFDWVSRIHGAKKFSDQPNWLTGGRAAEFLAQDQPTHEFGGAVTEPASIQRIHPKTVYAAATQLRDPKVRANKPHFEEPYLYGVQRGWILDNLPNVDPYPVGYGFLPGNGDRARALSDHPLLSFPKMVRTRRVARLFGLEDDWQRYGNSLCVGVKYRLTPQASGKLIEMAMDSGLSVQEALADEPRWLARPGFTASIPWEFDEHEQAEKRINLEGPGDGAR